MPGGYCYCPEHTGTVSFFADRRRAARPDAETETAGPVNVYRNLFVAAAANLARYRLRSVVVVICLVAICGPYVTGIAISEGIRAEAEVSVQEGADLYLTLDQFGRNGPVPLAVSSSLSQQSAHHRRGAPHRRPGHGLRGRAGSGKGRFGTGGHPRSGARTQMELAPSVGRACAAPAYAAGGEVMIGSALADHLGLRPGQQISLKVADVTDAFSRVGDFSSQRHDLECATGLHDIWTTPASSSPCPVMPPTS